MGEPIGSLTKWLGGQMPSVQKKVKPVHLDRDEVVLHIGPSKIKSFYPCVPGSVAPGEDTGESAGWEGVFRGLMRHMVAVRQPECTASSQLHPV